MLCMNKLFWLAKVLILFYLFASLGFIFRMNHFEEASYLSFHVFSLHNEVKKAVL